MNCFSLETVFDLVTMEKEERMYEENRYITVKTIFWFETHMELVGVRKQWIKSLWVTTFGQIYKEIGVCVSTE